MNILVVGGDSKLGGPLIDALIKSDDGMNNVMWTTRRKALVTPTSFWCDLSEPVPIKSELIVNNRIKLIYIVAAVTGIMRCEVDAAASWRVNADGPSRIARTAASLSASERSEVVFISSDAVEGSPRLNYAMQKAYAEQSVLRHDGVVVRPGPINHENRKDLLRFLIEIGVDRSPADTRGRVFRWPNR